MSELTAGQLLALLSAARDKVDTLSGELREAKQELDVLEERVMLLMEQQGTTLLAAGGLISELKEEDVPQVNDWDKFEAFVLRHKRLDILQRRLSPVVWRALIEERNGTAVPGVGVFKKRKLSVRKGK